MRIVASSLLFGAAAWCATACFGGGDSPVDGGGAAPVSDAGSKGAFDSGNDGEPESDSGTTGPNAPPPDASLLVLGDGGGCAVAPYTAPAPPDDASTSVSNSHIAFSSVRSGTDAFDWTQLPGGSFSASNTPLCVTSSAGLNATITNPTGAVFKDVQGNPWAGNFAPNDVLLCSGQVTTTGPITITFARPVSGVGAQMGADIVSGTGVQFLGEMVLIGTSGQTVATFVADGMMDTAADNSAVYIGATDTVPEIKAVEFFISGAENASNNAYCMNRLSIQP